MNTTSSLVLGLGGFGGLVVRMLRERLAGTPKARTVRFLLLDAPGPDGPPASLETSGPPTVEPVLLSMDSVREILGTAQEWAPYLPWLARFDRGQLLDELRPYGTAGYRCLGRLALVRSAGVIDRVLRRHLHELRREAPIGATDAILIAGAGGGLGSSILADLTFLLQRLGQTTSRTACLLLPPEGEAGRNRFQANAFATICEASALKARQASWENRFEQLPALEVEPRTWEPWQRLYLFQAGIEELPPYEATARQVAETLAVQLSPEVVRQRHLSSQDLPVLDFGARTPGPRSDAGFSSCYGTSLDLASLAPVDASTEEAGSGSTLRVDPYLLGESVKSLLDDVEQDLLELRSVLYQKRKRELGDLNQDLSAREAALLYTVLEPEERDPAPELMLDPQAVLRLPGAEKALRWLWAELRKPAPEIPRAPVAPASADFLSARQQIDDLVELREDAAQIWKGAPAPASSEGKRSKRGFWLPRLQRNMLWNLSQRFSTAQTLLRTPEFQQALGRAFEEILRGWNEQRQGEDEDLRAFPSLESWLERLEGDLQAVARGVFQASRPQPERRHFAWLVLPESLPEDLSREAIRERVERITKDQLQCTCETLDSEEGQIGFYYEDLFRSPAEIRSLPVYRRAYLDEPQRESLHADYRFLEKEACREIYGAVERSATCGNPECEFDLRNLPADAVLCEGCERPIRSRCGNPECSVRDLHLRSEAHDRTCPGCGGVNRAAWWICCQHGKIEHYVPVDKHSCPECIRRHHDDPDGFPLSQVGRRPYGEGSRTCPHCEELARHDSDHRVFWIPAELEPFVDHGVNGHDRQRFEELAKKHKMREDRRCPRCGTLLIPVDHRGEGEGLC